VLVRRAAVLPSVFSLVKLMELSNFLFKLEFVVELHDFTDAIGGGGVQE
jgi:hypothetical protein